MVIWLTGLTSSGKTTLGRNLLKALAKTEGVPCFLDGDYLRKTLSADLGFSEADRKEHNRRVIKKAVECEKRGNTVIVALISPYRDIRREARKASLKFIEVYVKCPLPLCKKRDTKRLYERFEKNEISQLAGLDMPYEEPEKPEVVVETDKETITESLAKIMKVVNPHKIYSMVIGRFQVMPPHAGHQALIDSLLRDGKNVCIALRQEDGTETNPYSFYERSQAFADLYGREIAQGRVKIISIPDIEEVVYGRDVGWKLREIRLPSELEAVSGTQIRREQRE